jgi:hypothetical protein
VCSGEKSFTNRIFIVIWTYLHSLSFRLNVALQASRALAFGFVSLSFCISQVCMKTLAHHGSPLRQESNGFNASQ